MLKNKNEDIKIGKNMLREIDAEALLKLTTVESIQALKFEAANNVFDVANDAYQRYCGSNYIISQIKKSEVIPKGLLRNGNQLSYVGANGKIITTTDSSDLILELCDAGLDVGFSPEWMLIFFKDLYGYDIPVDGISPENLDEIRKIAYTNPSITHSSRGQ